MHKKHFQFIFFYSPTYYLCRLQATINGMIKNNQETEHRPPEDHEIRYQSAINELKLVVDDLITCRVELKEEKAKRGKKLPPHAL